MDWIQLMIGAISFGVGAVIIPEQKIMMYLGERKSKRRIIYPLILLIVAIVLGHFLHGAFHQFFSNRLLANIVRSFIIGVGVGVFLNKGVSEKVQEKEHVHKKNKSYIDENTGEIILRCQKYPKRGSKVWTIDNDYITIQVIGKKDKKNIYPISDIKKNRFKAGKLMSTLELVIKVDGRFKCRPIIFLDSGIDSDIARKANDYILGKSL